MGKKDCAIAIVNDYVTAWVKFTQSGIACYVRAIEENGRKAASIRDHHLPSKGGFLEKDLPHQFEQMKRQLTGGDETQVRQLVDWIRKGKIWEKEHGFDDDVDGGGPTLEYRHFLR
jgi:hypothetical protein